MLINELVGACNVAYDNSNAGACGAECNNKEFCIGNCNDCLDQVHWWPHKGGRSDYNCKKLIYYYVQRFSKRYCDNILSVSSLIDFERYPGFYIVSVGCGAAPDLMAFEEIAGRREIFYRGYDRNELWRGIHSFIGNYAKNTNNIAIDIRIQDIFSILKTGGPGTDPYPFNIVIIQFLISHLYNSNQESKINELYDGIVENIVCRRLRNLPFLLIVNDIDSRHKGRNTFHRLIDKLEIAGCFGQAFAKSYHENGDLGRTRWGRATHNRYGAIKYSYIKCLTEYDSAQLIVELG